MNDPSEGSGLQATMALQFVERGETDHRSSLPP